MKRHSVALLAALLAFAFACASPRNRDDEDAMPRAQYKGEVGASPVGVIPDAELHDAKRNKDVTITIEYPTRSAANPLIVFSPGFGGSNDSYVGLSSYWASQGFVVIRVAHADAGRRLSDGQDFWETQTETERRDRVRDLTFVLDSLDTLEERYPELAKKIDRAKIVVAGHSYGAYTALLLGGMKMYPSGTSYADARVKAVVAMSPQGPNESRGLTRQSWTDLHVPTLFMTGSRDQGPADSETPEWRSEAFELAAPGDKWLIVIEGARHSTFIGRYDALIEAQSREARPLDPATGRRYPTDPLTQQEERRDTSRAGDAALRQRDLFGTIKAMSLAFLDSYMKSDAKGHDALESAMTSSGVTVKKK